MTATDYHSSESDLDRKIEALVGKLVRGEITDEECISLSRLVAQRGHAMRPSRGRHLKLSAAS